MRSFFVGHTPTISIVGGIVHLIIEETDCAMALSTFTGILASGTRAVGDFQRGIIDPLPLRPKPKKGKKRKH